MSLPTAMCKLYEEDQGFLGVSWSPGIPGYVMHVELYRWSVSEFKRYLEIFHTICDVLKSKGVTKLYGLCKTSKHAKFNAAFGFVESQTRVYDLEDGFEYIVMEYEL